MKITLSNQQFLPIKLILKIHTDKFLKCFTASQNLLCLLFNSIATQQLNSIFASVDTSVNSARELVDIISNNSLNQSEIIIGLAYVHLVLILYAFIILCYFRCCHLWRIKKMNIKLSGTQENQFATSHDTTEHSSQISG